MSAVSSIHNLATRVATEFNAVRSEVGDRDNLATSARGSLVAAVNELKAALDSGSGGASSLSQLSDVRLGTENVGDLLYRNGVGWVNKAGDDLFDPAGAAAAAQAASQPASDNLTALAAVVSTAYGRALLELVDAAELTASLEPATEAAAGAVRLATTEEAVAGTSQSRATTPAGVRAAVNAAVEILVGEGTPEALDTFREFADAINNDPSFGSTVMTALAGKQPLDADLTAIAGLSSAPDQIPYATGVGSWEMTGFTTAGRAVVGAASASIQRQVLDVYSRAEIGDVSAADFVGTFESGLVR